jgi:hypothetical protein
LKGGKNKILTLGDKVDLLVRGIQLAFSSINARAQYFKIPARKKKKKESTRKGSMLAKTVSFPVIFFFFAPDKTCLFWSFSVVPMALATFLSEEML